MYSIQTLNKISTKGLELFPRDQYEVASQILNPDAIIVRSYNLHNYDLADSVKAIARAGAGVNNIPIEYCSQKGIVVFNTPGANANSVKEIVIASLFLSSRKIYQGIQFAHSLIGQGDKVPKLIEQGKANYSGPEIKRKKLGIIGLGNIGVMVANSAVTLGMEVVGYDPFISVEAAWGLSRSVTRAPTLEHLLSESEYVTIHTPLNDATKGMLNQEKFRIMKPGLRLLNFSRGGLVNNNDLKQAINEGIIACYVTDFPDEELLENEAVITIPHLGATTPESEDNCAMIAATRIRDFLETGSIKKSVNFPDCEMDKSNGQWRLIIANENIPNMVSQIAAVLAEQKINIAEMINKHHNNIAYNIIDTDSNVSTDMLAKIRAIEGVLMARVLEDTKR